jgi:hypothetical protein
MRIRIKPLAVIGFLLVVVWIAIAAHVVHSRSSNVPHIQATVSAGKPQIKLSELRPALRLYVEDVSHSAREHGMEELSQEQKNKLIETIIADMEAQGTYEFVE